MEQGKLTRRLAELEEQNKALLEACNKSLTAIRNSMCGGNDHEMQQAIDALVAVIAKARGQS